MFTSISVFFQRNMLLFRFATINMYIKPHIFTVEHIASEKVINYKCWRMKFSFQFKLLPMFRNKLEMWKLSLVFLIFSQSIFSNFNPVIFWARNKFFR